MCNEKCVSFYSYGSFYSYKFSNMGIHGNGSSFFTWNLKVCLKSVQNTLLKSFNSILTENNLKAIHKKTPEFLAIEVYKFQNGLSPPIMNDIFFSRQNTYNLRKFHEFSTSTKNTEFRYGNYLVWRPILWNLSLTT